MSTVSISKIEMVCISGERPASVGLKVKSAMKAGFSYWPTKDPPAGHNHGLKVKSAVKAGKASASGEEPPFGSNHGLQVKRRATTEK